MTALYQGLVIFHDVFLVFWGRKNPEYCQGMGGLFWGGLNQVGFKIKNYFLIPDDYNFFRKLYTVLLFNMENESL